MRKEYDVVVVGAGPAGSTIGYLLKKENLNVLIIDKEKFPRRKLCGGLITAKTKDLFEEIYKESFSVYENKTDILCLYYNKKLIHKVKTNQPFYFVDRSIFDNQLLEKYKNIGGDVIEGSNINHFDFANHSLDIDNTIISYKYLVGADGANSVVRKYIDNKYKPNALCLETNCYDTKMSLDKIHVLFGERFCGYGWIFPKKNYVTIGIGGNIESKNNIEKQKLEELIQFSGSTDIPKIRGAFIPYGKYIKIPFKNNVVLIGDAAGLVDPITGEGIYFALQSALNIARDIAQKISSSSFFDNQTQDCYKGIHQKIDTSRKFQRCLSNDFLLKIAFHWLKKRDKFIIYACENCVSYYRISLNKLLISYMWTFINK